MLSLSYLYLPTKYIENREDFYRSGIQEASKIRNLINICNRIFITKSTNINLYLVGDKDMYKVEVFDNKTLVCIIYYLPKQMRLDIFDGSDTNSPVFMWKSKTCVQKNIPIIMEKVGADKLFLPLLSIL